ncbi:hypothetical protein BLS_008499 [Venturia inaequalis]|uniref:Uncharacterized protein n=1 Tax=Venturia inaequalis TaxID=5025 RepID=A0A8H3YN68_VENIN|nr:hypothetical protein BLS_008499 [Venturia inaequalis]
MSFCNTLRRRPSCSGLIPVLLAADGLPFKESELKTHDLAIPIPSQVNPRSLRVIILTPSSLSPEKMDATLSRLQHFESLTGGTDSAIMFPLFPAPSAIGAKNNASEPFPSSLHAFTEAQLLLMEQSINIPILPLSAPSSLPKIISSFISSLNSSLAVSTTMKPVNAAVDVLPYATGNGSMSQEVHIAMTDMFTSMRDVAGMGSGEETRRTLVQKGLAEDEAEDCMQFWVEEWICE